MENLRKTQLRTHLANRIPWYSSSCLMKLGLGLVTVRLSFTQSQARSRFQPYSFIAQAITVEADRLTPILQCTRHLDPCFLVWGIEVWRKTQQRVHFKSWVLNVAKFPVLPFHFLLCKPSHLSVLVCIYNRMCREGRQFSCTQKICHANIKPL